MNVYFRLVSSDNKESCSPTLGFINILLIIGKVNNFRQIRLRNSSEILLKNVLIEALKILANFFALLIAGKYIEIPLNIARTIFENLSRGY